MSVIFEIRAALLPVVWKPKEKKNFPLDSEAKF